MYKMVDVSQFQKNIDWGHVKKAGYDCAMIRCGGRYYISGRIYGDPYCEINIKNALANGLHVGLYFFSQAITEKEAIEEANYMINIAKKYPKIDMPLAIDSEINYPKAERLATISKNKRTNYTIAFLEEIKKAGYIPMLYCNNPHYNTYLEPARLSKYELWLAQWTKTEKPTCKRDYSIWQYSEKGMVDGINNYVDVNYCYKEFWKKPKEYKDSIKIMAVDVLFNKYGTGEERKNKLGTYYNEVQALVNDILKIVKG